MRTITALACLLFCCAAAEPVPDFKTLYESHDWFRLREALQSAADAPPLYRAAVGAAFHDDAAAERALKTIAGSAAKGSWKANEAVRLLYSVTRRTAPDLDQPVGAPRPSRIRYTMKNHLLHVPLTIDGQAVEYIFDTGAGCSLTMESEGKRLGLKLHDTDAQHRFSIRSPARRSTSGTRASRSA